MKNVTEHFNWEDIDINEPMSQKVAQAYLDSRERLDFPMLKK